MPNLGWIPMLACTLLLSQEAPFPEEKPAPWVPRWEATVRAERIGGMVGYGADDVRREGIQLRLRWNADWACLEWQAGLRAATGSDGNRHNIPRWDQQPSNGTQLDLAQASLKGLSERWFGELRLGFQELGLVTTQAVWDGDLRFLGAGAGGGWRSGPVREAGFRGAWGRVRTVYPRDDADLSALQAVLRLETGAFTWLLHADRWALDWDPRGGRFEAVAYDGVGRQRLVLDGLGASAKWEGWLPLEVRWSGYRDRNSRQTSEEFQAVAGNRVRPYRPQASFTWQRLSENGCLYPLNSDQWWYYRGARGPRYDLTLPLPGQWSLTLAHLRQRTDWTPVVAQKTMLTAVKRF